MKPILAYFKETGNKYRWDADCDGAPFEIYIPKLRVPEPIPEIIQVGIYNIEDKQFGSITGIQVPNSDVSKPIIALLKFKDEKTKTVRYDPMNEFKLEIGSPYIPISLLTFPYPDKLTIKIDWKK